MSFAVTLCVSIQEESCINLEIELAILSNYVFFLNYILVNIEIFTGILANINCTSP